jgi:hypothetical protein
LVSEYAPEAYRAAAQTIRQMARDAATRPRMRDIAFRLFDLQAVGTNRYARLYRNILAA